jgi:hypothetical protein
MFAEFSQQHEESVCGPAALLLSGCGQGAGPEVRLMAMSTLFVYVCLQCMHRLD